MKNIVILGATGSIGRQTLDVIESLPGELRVHGVSAHGRWRDLREIAQRHHPKWVTITDSSLRGQLGEDGSTGFGRDAPILFGSEGVEEMVRDVDTDVVVTAMVGAAGLNGTLAALDAGKSIALANKETLVVGGSLVMRKARENDQPIIPVDSEHSAIFQCLQGHRRDEVARLILTASGGPFREWPFERFQDITAEQALRHPTWQMGPKITIDSATMMNKALEIIEAHYLFGLDAEQIAVVIHPQSMVHSLVEYVDGSVLAQISPPDMRLPIQYALTYPRRRAGGARRLELERMGTWEFGIPDPRRYPALSLGYEVVRRGGTAGAALNAANEVAVARFLKGRLPFLQIVPLAKHVLDHHFFEADPSLDDLRRVDAWARQEAERWT